MARRLACSLAILVSVLFGLPGCSADNQVSGRVTFEGKPVSLGTVVFVGADGAPRTALIAPDGSFEITGLRPGLAKIAVISIDPGQLDPSVEAELQEKFERMGLTLPPANSQTPTDWFPIPHAYADIETSQLTADINRGPNQIDIKLENKAF